MESIAFWRSGVVLLVLVHLSVPTLWPGFVSGCRKVERDALFKFKRSVSDPENLLSSWEGEDCCRWKGVTCNNVTDHVETLSLNPLEFDISSFLQGLTAKKLDPCLLELRQLRCLDLSGNDFQGSPIPMFICSMKQLRHLDLSRARFGGVVPHSLGNLTRLQFLDLGGNLNYMSKLIVDDLHWLSRLSDLEHLGLSYLNLSNTLDSMGTINRFPSLSELELAGCDLGDSHLSRFLLSNSTWPSIQKLYISDNYLNNLPLNLFSNLSSLKFLDVSRNNLNSLNSLEFLKMTPLLELSLAGCELDNSNLSCAVFSNSTWISTIQRLYLSSNHLDGPSLDLFANMSSLITLDLSHNRLRGSVPLWLRNMENLKSLLLGSNYLSQVEGEINKSITRKICKLKELDFSHNQFEGEISNFFKNLTELFITDDMESLSLYNNTFTGMLPYGVWGKFQKLRSLDLSRNRLSGQIPESIGSLFLEELDMSRNNLNGFIPSFQANDCHLVYLDLSNNHLSGKIPLSLGQCKNVTNIHLSSNFLQSVVSDHHFANLSKLQQLDLSFNSLTLDFSANWKPPFQLSSLLMSCCKIKGRFPEWIRTQNQLSDLDLSNCEILGEMPEWLWGKDLLYLNLSYNHITGQITYFSSRIMTIDLSHNLFSGPISHDQAINTSLVPYTLCELRYLSFLALDHNSLSGTIPDCWNRSQLLNVINLSMNTLSGHIPVTLSTCKSLVILDLGENMLSGETPSFGAHGNPNLQILRLRENQLRGVIPQQLCSLHNLLILDLARNNISGTIPRCLGNLNGMELPHLTPLSPGVVAPVPSPVGQEPLAYEPSYYEGETAVEVLKGQELQYTTLKYVVNLDLSSNGIVGVIPEEIVSLSRLIGLNLSHNHLTGPIPEKIGEMSSLESLDLSDNNISGTIPTSIADLNFLSHLNLSHNKLNGQIPTGNQLQVLDEDPSIYIGNPGLCGDPLDKKCVKENSQHEQQLDDNEDSRETVWFYVVVMSGFLTGFWCVVGTLLLKKTWRHVLFRFVEDVMDYFYVQVINRLRN